MNSINGPSRMKRGYDFSDLDVFKEVINLRFLSDSVVFDGVFIFRMMNQ